MYEDRSPKEIGSAIGKTLWDTFAAQIAPYEDDKISVEITFTAMAETMAMAMVWITQGMPPPVQIRRTKEFFQELERNLLATLKAYHVAQSRNN